jgi:uncharacterized membrane protein YjjB (DUF3815 family)
MKNHTQPDAWLYRIAVVLFGLTVVVSVALGSVAIGGLAGLLAPSPLNR